MDVPVVSTVVLKQKIGCSLNSHKIFCRPQSVTLQKTAISIYFADIAMTDHTINRITHTPVRGVAKQKNIVTNKFNGALKLLTCIRGGSGSSLSFSFKVFYLGFTKKKLFNSLQLGTIISLKTFELIVYKSSYQSTL